MSQVDAVIHDFQFRVVDRLGIKITINTFDDRNLKLVVRKSETIVHILDKIRNRIRFSEDEHILLYQGRTLEFDKYVEYYNIGANDVLNLVVIQRVVILVKTTFDGRIIPFKVKYNVTIFDIKDIIAGMIGVERKDQVLKYNGRVLEDERMTLVEYNIKENCEIVIDKMLGLSVKVPDGRSDYVQVFRDATIFDVWKEVERNFGLSSDKYRLEYKGRILNNNGIVTSVYWDSHNSITVIPRLKGRISVFAKTMDENTFDFYCVSSDTMLEIKERIQGLVGLGPEEQILVYSGLVLTDGETVREFSIHGGSCINVYRRIKGKILSFICTMCGRRVALYCTKNDRIVDIKKIIQEKIGLAPDEQKLVYQAQIMDDDRTVDEYGLVDMSVVNVVARLRGGMQIFAKTMDGKTVAFEVNKNDRIIDIKKKIQEKIGLEPDEQKLVYQGGILEDYKTVDEYHIAEKSVINVVERLRSELQLRVFMKTTIGGIFPLSVSNRNTIFAIKTMVEQKTGFLRENHDLLYDGRILEDYGRLDAYGIKVGEVIEVIGRIRILKIRYIHEYDISFKMSGTVLDLKKEIQSILGLIPERQTLKYEDNILCDDKTISNHHIADAKVINIEAVFEPKQIFIKIRQQSNKITFPVDDSYIIMDIKTKIKEEIRLEPNKQLLRMNENILSDDRKTIYQCGITNNSVICVSELLEIIILSYNMETVSLKIYSCDRMIDVKKKIEEKIRIPWEDQILEYNDVIMNDDSTFDDYNIGTESGLLMSPKPLYLGICLIVNNETFTGPNRWRERLGSEKDEENIRKTFEKMGYIIKVHRNVSKEDMDNVTKDTKDSVEGCHKILIVFVLSHGDENGVVTSDLQVIQHKEIWSPFMNDRFPKLAGRNKFFFFSCCQGSNINTPVNVASTSHIQYDAPPSTVATTNIVTCPSMADIFIGYATSQSYRAARHTHNGTFYISSLCEVVREHPRWSINDIHTEVQKRLSRGLIEGTNEYQMPCFHNHLRDHAYFIETNL